ncbi:hypothetical protein ACVW0K_007182 [Streptomyces filamentosus]
MDLLLPRRPVPVRPAAGPLDHDRTGAAEYELGTGACVQAEVTT